MATDRCSDFRPQSGGSGEWCCAEDRVLGAQSKQSPCADIPPCQAAEAPSTSSPLLHAIIALSIVASYSSIIKSWFQSFGRRLTGRMMPLAQCHQAQHDLFHEKDDEPRVFSLIKTIMESRKSAQWTTIVSNTLACTDVSGHKLHQALILPDLDRFPLLACFAGRCLTDSRLALSDLTAQACLTIVRSNRISGVTYVTQLGDREGV